MTRPTSYIVIELADDIHAESSARRFDRLEDAVSYKQWRQTAARSTQEYAGMQCLLVQVGQRANGRDIVRQIGESLSKDERSTLHETPGYWWQCIKIYDGTPESVGMYGDKEEALARAAELRSKDLMARGEITRCRDGCGYADDTLYDEGPCYWCLELPTYRVLPLVMDEPLSPQTICDELTRITEEMGLYDNQPTTCAVCCKSMSKLGTYWANVPTGDGRKDMCDPCYRIHRD